MMGYCGNLPQQIRSQVFRSNIKLSYYTWRNRLPKAAICPALCERRAHSLVTTKKIKIGKAWREEFRYGSQMDEFYLKNGKGWRKLFAGSSRSIECTQEIVDKVEDTSCQRSFCFRSLINTLREICPSEDHGKMEVNEEKMPICAPDLWRLRKSATKIRTPEIQGV